MAKKATACNQRSPGTIHFCNMVQGETQNCVREEHPQNTWRMVPWSLSQCQQSSEELRNIPFRNVGVRYHLVCILMLVYCTLERIEDFRERQIICCTWEGERSRPRSAIYLLRYALLSRTVQHGINCTHGMVDMVDRVT